VSWAFASFALFAVMTGAGALYSAVWSPRARARRRLAASAETPLDDGTVVTLTGTVRALAHVEAPISGTPCVAFLAWGMASRGSGDENPQRISTQHVLPFELVTAHGVVRVEAAALIEITHPTHAILPRDLDREAKFLVAHGFNAWLVGTSYFQQATISDGDTIRVQGLALVEHAPPSDAHGYRETERSIRLVAHGEHPLTIGPA
jgi:hypothetical protein